MISPKRCHYRRFDLFIVISIGYISILILTLPSRIEAAHARKRPTIKSSSSSASSSSSEYDKRITSIDPSGRLLQVEYAMQAAHRHSITSTSAAALLTRSNVGVLVHISSYSGGRVEQQQQNEDSESETETETETETEPSSSASLSMTSSASNHQQGIMKKVHRVDPGTLCLTSGLDGDGRLLIRHLRNVSHREYHYESSSSTTNSDAVADVSALAKECARVQHQLTLTPGARPLGVSLTFLGRRTGNPVRLGGGWLGLYHCEAGGGMMEEACECTASGMGQDQLRKNLVQLLGELKQKEREMLVQHDEEPVKGERKTKLNSSTPSSSSSSAMIAKELITKELINGVSKSVFQQYKTTRNQRETGNGEQQQHHVTVDIYLIRPNPLCRGGVDISSATCVLEKDLDHVANLFVS